MREACLIFFPARARACYAYAGLRPVIHDALAVHEETTLQTIQLIYASQPFGFDDLALSGILNAARKNNQRDGITGALICREDLYLQMLEGRRDVVTAIYARILRDDRHTQVISLWTGDIETRLFPEWAMRHDPAKSWMWTAEQVAAGAIGRASAEEIRGVFSRLASEAPEGPQKCPAA